ncbi:hypothetical protein DUD99_16150 [Salmonella enterica subsp. enterica]|uniref:hypothetical protein n=1 Tax=Salmonella enterica TaxID=28901 RepID=UPI000B8A9F49|nr:hypothetical protein [Salmonella enterica]EAC2143753.1 hypothetical protein [Salmonella enterica subsp. enterica]EDR2627280.1 hypothetical protein [Salmonella enterica subsp. enterica serovar Thompson]EAW1858150.1 hypothetical protein [Salmonella enterica subsp. enterica]EAW1861755.1 hypothetical protein [Salmonella enterica subsp. enterica]EBD9555978.1 hypothetical protein [Salmonella enterica]
MIKIIAILFVFFLAGCTSQRQYSNIVRIKNVCPSDINILIPDYVFGTRVINQHHIYLPVGENDILAYFHTNDIDDGFKHEGTFMIYKDSHEQLNYPFFISSSGRVRKFGKYDLIRLSRDVSTKDDRKHGVVRYIIDSQEICP